MDTKKLFLILFLFSLEAVNAQYNLIRNYSSVPSNFYVHKEKLYFTAREIATNNDELWVYDSNYSISDTNPKLVKDLDNNPNIGSYPKNFITYNGKLFFSNNEYLMSFNDEQPISSTNPKIIGNRGNGLVLYNNNLYYEEASKFPNSWLWVYDDNQEISSSNPKKLILNSLINNSSLDFRFTSIVYNNKLYYCGRNLNDGKFELYVYDSSSPISTTNPKKVYDINKSYNGSSTPNDFIVFKDKLYFSANDGTGEELWEYDEINYPKKTYDLNSSPYGGLFKNKTIYDDKLFFSANNNITGTELWKYDGKNNPELIADIYAGEEFSSPKNLTVYNYKLYFNASNNLNGNELWYYDSLLPKSETNPAIIDIFTGTESGIDSQSDIIIYNDELYFSGKTSNSNIGLFKLNTNNLETKEFSYKSDIIIYPNPSSEIITIECFKENLKSIRINNTIGQNIQHLKTTNKKEVIKFKDSGVYFIIIETENNITETRKIIIK